MTIETKYDVENKVFVLHGNKIVEGKIARIKVNSYEANINYPIQSHIRYDIKTDLGPKLGNKDFTQLEIFKTKEELIANL